MIGLALNISVCYGIRLKNVGLNKMNSRSFLAEVNEEALTADGYDDALIGYVERAGQAPVALYDRNKCIEVLMDRDEITWEEACEFFDYNTMRAYAGNFTPFYATFF